MTITLLRSETPITDDDRVAALIWFAEQAELRHPDLDPVLPAVVAALAHPTHVDAGTHMALFLQLQDALREYETFDRDAVGYADDHELPTRSDAILRLDDSLRAQVDMAAFDLVHPGPACLTCRRTSPRQAWRASEMPSSVFCTEHRKVRSA